MNVDAMERARSLAYDVLGRWLSGLVDEALWQDMRGLFWQDAEDVFQADEEAAPCACGEPTHPGEHYEDESSGDHGCCDEIALKGVKDWR